MSQIQVANEPDKAFHEMTKFVMKYLSKSI